MKWIGQHIWDFISRFRNDVYIEDLTEQEEEFSVMVGPDGKLTKSTHPGERSRIQVRNDEGATIPAGAPLYSKGEIGGSERILVGICDSGDTAKMPCIGIAEAEMNTTSTKDNFAITQGVYNTNISGFTGLSVGDTLYVNGGSAPHLTQTKPTNGDLIQNVGIVLKTNGTICQGLLVSAIGRTNDVPWPLYVDHANQRVGIGIASPTEELHVVGDALVTGNITANGNIIGDDGTNITNINSIEADTYAADADPTTKISMGATAIDCLVADTDVFQVTDSTFTFDPAVKTTIKKRKLTKTSNTDGNHDGDVVFFGGTTSMTAGSIYFYNSGSWELADADAESTSKGMMAVALGAASDTNGMLVRGMVTLSADPGTISDKLYLSTTGGRAQNSAPTGSGKVVRLIGYSLDSTNGQVYFNPDNHYTVL